MGKALILVALLALAACKTTGSGSFCDIAQPIRLSSEQVDQLTDAQVKELLAHNKKGAALCGWRP